MFVQPGRKLSLREWTVLRGATHGNALTEEYERCFKVVGAVVYDVSYDKEEFWALASDWRIEMV